MNQHIHGQFLRFPLIIRVLIISASIMIIFGTIIHFIEPENFPTIFDGIWWAIVTSSTVGYGDFAPKTLIGKVAGMLLILIGASFLTFYFAHLAASAIERQNDFLEGKHVFKGMEHFIIVGWNERSRKIIADLAIHDPQQPIILIDETLEKMPVKHANVHFIKGRANNDETLGKAKLSDAKCIVITADPNKGELQADMNTILTLLAVKGINPEVNCIAEILMTEQVANARRAGADKIIQTNELLSSVMLNRMLSSLSESAFNELIFFKQNWLNYIPVSEDLVGVQFNEASMCFFSKNKILVGVIREEDSHVNPPHNFELKKDDKLLVINQSLLI